MQFYIARNGQRQGPFDLETVRSRLADGSLLGGDLGWHEGAADWLPLSAIPALAGGATPPPVPAGAFPAQRMSAAYAAPPRTSGLALASMILGILSFLTVGLTSLPAVICGHLSLSRIKKAAGAVSGHGFAVAGLVMGYVGLCFFALFVLGVLAGIALPVFNQVQEKGRITKSMAEAKQVGLALKTYAVDNGGKYPAQLDDLVPTYLSDKHLFICPLGKGGPNSGYNYRGYGVTDDDDPATVLLTSQATTSKHQRIVVHLNNLTDLEHE